MSDDGSNDRTRRGILVLVATAIASAVIILYDAISPDGPQDGYGSGSYGGGGYGE